MRWGGVGVGVGGSYAEVDGCASLAFSGNRSLATTCNTLAMIAPLQVAAAFVNHWH